MLSHLADFRHRVWGEWFKTNRRGIRFIFSDTNYKLHQYSITIKLETIGSKDTGRLNFDHKKCTKPKSVLAEKLCVEFILWLQHICSLLK